LRGAGYAVTGEFLEVAAFCGGEPPFGRGIAGEPVLSICLRFEQSKPFADAAEAGDAPDVWPLEGAADKGDLQAGLHAAGECDCDDEGVGWPLFDPRQVDGGMADGAGISKCEALGDRAERLVGVDVFGEGDGKGIAGDSNDVHLTGSLPAGRAERTRVFP
jgi:hypothetical protein